MNVIFLMNDTFRRDHLGCYGNNWIKTPRLDELASQAALFEQCSIASYPTVPNRWDLCTGRYGFPFRGWQPLGDGNRTWAQILSRNEFHTQMIWDTPMLGRDNYNYTRGFSSAYFVHSQKGDSWITDPSLPIRMPSQAHKIRSMTSLESYLRNHHDRRYDYGLYADPDYSGERHIYPEYGRSTYLTKAEQADLKALYAGNVTLVDRWMGH